MSKLIVEVVEVEEVVEHPNADRLSVARVKGWDCIVGKGQFNKGDKAVYIPIDSVLPPPIWKLLFSLKQK